MPEEQKAEEKQETRRKLPGFVGKFIPYLIIIILAVGGTAYVARQKPEILGLSKGQAQVQAEIDKLVADVGKLIALPKDEKPTVATVTDIEKVKDQPFFKNAKNGDKVLIYTNEKKAILYRPTENLIVEVGAVNINQTPQESPSPSPKESPTPAPEQGQ